MRLDVLRTCAALPLLAALQLPARAQEPAENATVLNPIVVSSENAGVAAPADSTRLMPEADGGQVAKGSRLGILGNRDVMSTPFNITAYTSKLIADKLARNISDVAANDPSVRTIFPRSSYRDVFNIRGFNLFSYNIGFDGLYGITPKQRFPAEFAERVEILKGPDTFVNGVSISASVGGAINIVPKRAGDDPVTSVTTSYASDGEFGTHLDFARRYGDDEQFGIRWNGVLRGGEPAVDDQSGRLGAMALSLDYEGENFRLFGDFGHFDQSIDAPDWSATLADNVVDIPVPNNTISLSQPWSFMKTKDTYGVLRAEYDLTDSWTAFGSFGISTTDTKGVFVQAEDIQANGDYKGTITSFPSGGTHYSGQAGIRGQFDTGPVQHNVNVTLASWGQNTKTTGNNLGEYDSNIFNPVAIPVPDMSAVVDLDDIYRTGDNRFTSLALADTLSMFDERVLLTLGGRWQNIDLKSFWATTGAVRSHYNRSKFSPAVGIVVKPLDNISLYANYMEALNRGPTAPDDPTITNHGKIFPPIVSQQLEAGIKVDLDGWMASFSAFRITQPNANGIIINKVFTVDGEQRNQGLELNVSGEPIAGLRILGGVAVLDGRQTKTANGTLNGKKATGVPDYQINMGAEWDIPSVEGLTLSGRVLNTGRQFANAANTQELDSWTRVDVGGRYVFERQNGKPITLRFGIENLFDKNYWASASTGQAAGISRGAPRTLLLSSTFDF